MNMTRFYVNVDFSKQLPKKIALKNEYYECLQSIEYELLPIPCGVCKTFGHLTRECPDKPANTNTMNQETNQQKMPGQGRIGKKNEWRPKNTNINNTNKQSNPNQNTFQVLQNADVPKSSNKQQKNKAHFQQQEEKMSNSVNNQDVENDFPSQVKETQFKEDTIILDQNEQSKDQFKEKKISMDQNTSEVNQDNGINQDLALIQANIEEKNDLLDWEDKDFSKIIIPNFPLNTLDISVKEFSTPTRSQGEERDTEDSEG